MKSSTHRLLVIMGTRPEAIKMAPLIKELKKKTDLETRVCVTAQHREMLDQVLDLFEIQPEYDLNLMRPGQTLPSLTSLALQELSKVMDDYKPTRALVHGDTTTTFVASLASFYHRVRVGHVEAGLRTNDIWSPWPEEANRQLTSILTDLHFAPTEQSAKNLLAEGVDPSRIHVTGNTVIDALLLTLEKIRANPELKSRLREAFPYLTPERKTILVTNHRRENFGDGVQRICMALKQLAARDDVRIVFPVHPNPHIRGPVHEQLSSCPNIHLIEPLDYLSFVYMLSECHIALTDSGGVQEEAPSLGKPVLVMRETTERPEAVTAGTVRLVGTDMEKIVAEAISLLENRDEYVRMSRAHNPYGDGLASRRIVEVLANE